MEKVTISYFLNLQRISSADEAAITLRVNFKGKACFREPIKKVPPNFWNNDKQEVIRSYPGADYINKLLSKRKAEIEQKIMEIQLMDMPITEAVIKKLCGGQELSRNYFEFCRSIILVKYPAASQEGTRKQHLSELNKLAKFKNSVSFGDINYKFLAEYKAYMISKLKNADNTVWKTFKAMNTMINEAIKQVLIKDNPFKEFNRGRYEQGKRKFLNLTDCDKIYALLQTDIPERLRVVGIYYLFMCYTGFRFNDAVLYFNYQTHVIDNERIIFTTEKTGTEVNLLIHNRLRLVLDYVKNNPLKISNQEFNRYTKVLATMAGIDIEITAHTGRHTFGATLAELDVPITTAQKLLGHRDIDSTKIYYHIKNKLLDKEMSKWDGI
jgi:site-specific recombinase XerD